MTTPPPHPSDLSSEAAPPPPPAGWPPTARWAVGCGAGCTALILLQGLLAWLLLDIYFRSPPATALQATITPPAEVPVGASFPLTLTLRNGGSVPVRIDSISARARNLDGLTVQNPQPRPRNTETSAKEQVWSYGRSLAKGETWTLRLDARAVRPGRLNGALSLSANWEARRVPFRVTAHAPADRTPK